MTQTPQILSAIPCQLGEGLYWRKSNQALYWVDIQQGRLFRYCWASKTVEQVNFERRLGWVIEAHDGELLLGFEDGVAVFDESNREVQYCWNLNDPDKRLRLNDACIDKQGNIWFGTMHDAEELPLGALWRIDVKRNSCQMIDDGYVVSNGPLVSSDGLTVLSTSSSQRTIYQLSLNQTGQVLSKKPFIQFSEDMGYPDGMVFDASGKLWVASWGGGKVFCFDNSGTIVGAVQVPAPLVTNIAFVGAEQVMCVTTARGRLSEQQLQQWPLSGHTMIINRPDAQL